MSEKFQEHHLENVGSRETHRVAPGHHERFRKPERLERLRPDELINEFGLEPGQIVMDVGCGDGVFFGPLSRAVGMEGQVIGLDIEEEMIRLSRETVEEEQLPNVEVKQSSNDGIPLDDNSADAAILINSLHEMAYPEKSLAELRRVLKPGGRILVYDRHKEETGEDGPPKHHLISRQEALDFFDDAGYQPTRFIDWDPDMYCFIVA